ncbi:hypothetical protein LCGC14_3154820 [marine sediment metagenome]|uniref:Uncharacterized protein n=1 Tax=marine sediment metagenome TaxID=412755 RepID=A0A0F8WH32_9ZZZZ
MNRLTPYTIRVPDDIKAALPAAASRYGMTAPELVRTVLGMIASGHVSLTLKQEAQNEQPVPANV